MNGKFIVLYGINNLGKSTQAKLLAERLEKQGRVAKYLKYPLYDLPPSGKILNDYLRAGNPYQLSSREAQIIYAYNRAQYEPQLKADLEKGIDVVAEDYWGTGVAWGVGAGVDKDFLLALNKHYNFEDLALLLVGKRFKTAIEQDHLHETNEQFTDKVNEVHLDLARDFGWKTIKANRDITEVADDIWKEVKKIL